MADIATAIRAVLAADGGVSALASTRIYPDRLPQVPTYPAITYELADEASFEEMAGLTGLAEAIVEVRCWAVTRLGAAALQDAVRLALANYQGTSSGVVVRRVHTGIGNAGRDEPDDKSDLPTYYHERDYHAFYCEATS